MRGQEKHTIEWLHTCIIHAVVGSNASSMVTRDSHDAMGSVTKSPTASKPRGMKPSSHTKPINPGIVVSPYEEDTHMEQTVEEALSIAQRQNGNAISEGESDVSAASKNASKKKKKRKPKRKNKQTNGGGDTLTVLPPTEGGLTAPTSWYNGYESATTDGSVTDGGESDVSRNSTSKSRRKLGKKIKKGSLHPGAGYDAIVQKMTGSTQDVMFVKPFFFPDYDGKSFDVSFIESRCTCPLTHHHCRHSSV